MSPADGWVAPDDAAADDLLDGRGLRIGVSCGRFNQDVTSRLLEGALTRLAALGVAPDATEVFQVPGAFELPLVARALATGGAIDAVIALGAVIRGETTHYDFVAGECAAGLQRVQLDTGVPVVFGVLTTENLEQALDRCGGRHGHKGEEAADTAVEMANLLRRLGERVPAPSPRNGTARLRHGAVASFDEARGTGVVRDTATGDEVPFHCTVIADGTRTIAAGAAVVFTVVAGLAGEHEAGEVLRLSR
jgi:6,7-dimethyl-8-ribityllumazine synthase